MVELGHKIIGNGTKTILFLHELMGDHRNYDSILPFLDIENFTYIFIDHRGYGLSRDILGDYTCEEAANDVKNLITKLGLNEVYLTAHSMSTMIAQKVALIDTRIKKLILITPIPASGIKMSEKAKDNMLDEILLDDGFLEQVVEDSSKRHTQTWKKYRIDMAYSSSILEARAGYMNMYLTTNFIDEAEDNINIPIKIIVGKHDFPVFGMNQVSKNFSAYKDVQIVECLEAGHYPMIECPVFFATKIEQFCK